MTNSIGRGDEEQNAADVSELSPRPAPHYSWGSRVHGAGSDSAAADLLENLEFDIEEERQLRSEEFSDDWPL